MSAPITDLAAKARPGWLHLRPRGHLVGLAWDALAVLDAPSASKVAHWAGMTRDQAARCMERLCVRGLAEGVGLVPIHRGGREQTYRLRWPDA